MNPSHGHNANLPDTDSDLDSGDDLPDQFVDWDELDMLEEVDSLTEKLFFAGNNEHLYEELEQFDEQTDDLFRQIVANDEMIGRLQAQLGILEWELRKLENIRYRLTFEKRLLEGLCEQQGLLDAAAAEKGKDGPFEGEDDSFFKGL